jgi:hypothetical protein
LVTINGINLFFSPSDIIDRTFFPALSSPLLDGKLMSMELLKSCKFVVSPHTPDSLYSVFIQHFDLLCSDFLGSFSFKLLPISSLSTEQLSHVNSSLLSILKAKGIPFRKADLKQKPRRRKNKNRRAKSKAGTIPMPPNNDSDDDENDSDYEPCQSEYISDQDDNDCDSSCSEMNDSEEEGTKSNLAVNNVEP